MTMFRRRDAWWEMDGKAARGERRRQRFVESVAFIAAMAATAGAATMWWTQVGVGAALHARLGIL
jgi:hypothetical protein